MGNPLIFSQTLLGASPPPLWCPIQDCAVLRVPKSVVFLDNIEELQAPPLPTGAVLAQGG